MIQEQNELRFMKIIKELEEEMKSMGKSSEPSTPSSPHNLKSPAPSLKPLGLNSKPIFGIPNKAVAGQPVKKPKPNLSINPKKEQSNKSSVQSPKESRMNDAATNTNEIQNMSDMLSFQLLNNSPTYEYK